MRKAGQNPSEEAKGGQHRTLLHRISHFFGWNTGQIWSVMESDGRLWIGYQCDTCHEVNGVHELVHDKLIELVDSFAREEE